jgi:multidrug efflux pump subunit AcrA (membrane-fusion protein)
MVLLNALPEKGFSGKITRFANAVDPQTRTMKTEIDLPNPGHRILPGMYGTVELKLAAESNALFVPGPSVRRDADGRPFVYTGAESDSEGASPDRPGRWKHDPGERLARQRSGRAERHRKPAGRNSCKDR